MQLFLQDNLTKEVTEMCYSNLWNVICKYLNICGFNFGCNG